MTLLKRMSFGFASPKLEHQNAQGQGKGQGISQNQRPLLDNEAVDQP